MKFHRYAISHSRFYDFVKPRRGALCDRARYPIFRKHACNYSIYVRRRPYQAINLKIPGPQKTLSKASCIDISISVSGRFVNTPVSTA
jgi:hypothetical protein